MPSKVLANHIMGADITWKHLGGDTILFTAAVYNNCESLNLSNTPFQYFEECSSHPTTYSVTGTMCCTKDVTPDLGYGCSKCGSPNCNNPFGIQIVQLQVKIVFPKSCCSWIVSWSQSSRDGAITTGAAGETFYTECEIDVCAKNPPDNSPFFNSPAVNISCRGTCTTLDNSATDIDRTSKGQHDSLIYSLVAPLQSHGKPITYSKGYAYFSPIATDTSATSLCKGFTLNTGTGSLQFNGLKSEVSVFAIQVEEYRPDSLGNLTRIGTIRRDMEILNIACPYNVGVNGDQTPIVTGINGVTTYSIRLCADQSTCFNIKAFDLDPQDTVSMSWDKGIPGATFTVAKDGKKWPTGVFCWTPTLSDVSAFPHNFTVTVVDNHKPPGKSSKTFSIYVTTGPSAVYSAKVTKCGVVEFNADVAPSSLTPITDYLWVGDGTQGGGPLYIHSKSGTFTYRRLGTYRFSLTITGPGQCAVTYNDSVFINPSPYVSIKDTMVCANSPNAIITAYGYGSRSMPYSYKWNTGDTTNSINVLITKDTSFTVTMTDASGCSTVDSGHVKLLKPPPPHPAVDKYICGSNYSMLYSALSSAVVWTKISGQNVIHNYSTFNLVEAKDSGLYIAMAQNSAACPGIDSFRVHYVTSGLLHASDTDVCSNDTVPIFPDAYRSGPVWIDTGFGYQILTHNLEMNSIKVTIPLRIKFEEPSKNSNISCVDTAIITIHIHTKPTPNLKSYLEICSLYNHIDLNSFVDRSYWTGGYWYYPKNYSAIIGNLLYSDIMGVTVNDSTLGYIHFHYTNQYKCTSDDSMRVLIWDRVSAGKGAVIWKECGRHILSTAYVHPRYGGIWTAGPNTPQACIEYSGDTVFFNPALVPGNGIYSFIYTYKDSNNISSCSGSDAVYINVVAKPTITINNIDTLCSNAGIQKLSASPAGGTWQFTDGTNPKALSYNIDSDSYQFNPAIAGQGPHHLQYSFAFNKTFATCTDAANTQIFVDIVPPSDFTTADHKWSYCSTQAPIALIPENAGGNFFGNGVFQNGGTWYFDPEQVDTLVKVIYRISDPDGKCSNVTIHNIKIFHLPDIKYTDTSVCGVNGVFNLKAIVKNAGQVSWSSPFNGVDGGYFMNPKRTIDSIFTVQFIPGTDELKQKYITIDLVAWADSLCDSVHTSYRIRIKPGPVVDFVSNREGCDSFTSKFTQLAYDSFENIVKYEWIFGDSSRHSFLTDPSHTFHADSTADVTKYNVSLSVTSGDGCENTILKKGWIQVDGKPYPIITAIPRFTTLDRATIQFGISKDSKNMGMIDSPLIYDWHFGDTLNHRIGGRSNLKDPEYTYTDTGYFTVVLKVTNGNGCIGMDSEIAFIDIRPAFAIFIPNVFLPGNKKGGGKYINFLFKPVITSYSSFEMSIYNRWGELVCKTSDPDTGWNGTFKGDLAPEDVYIYIIKAKSLYGQEYKYKGTVTLLR